MGEGGSQFKLRLTNIYIKYMFTNNNQSSKNKVMWTYIFVQILFIS